MIQTHSNPLVELTDGQKDCLRLVVQHFSSKEIGRRLCISQHTVDQRVKKATARLSATSRFEAARILANAEAMPHSEASSDHHQSYQRLVYQRSYLSEASKNAEEDPSPDGVSLTGDMVGATLREMQANYLCSPISTNQPRPFWSVLFEVGRENDLAVGTRIFLMVAIMLLSLLSLAVLVSILEGLSRLA